jgi:hypothetical protein
MSDMGEISSIQTNQQGFDILGCRKSQTIFGNSSVHLNIACKFTRECGDVETNPNDIKFEEFVTLE